MKYYKVPQRLDGREVRRQLKSGVWLYTPLVGGELFTEKECARIGLNKALCEPVEVSRKKIYFCFGARFENDF